MRSPGLLALALAGCIAVAAGAARGSETRAPADPHCAVVRELRAIDGDLPAARAAIAEGQKLTIVALGSSSTLGVGASSDERTYPAVLRQELARLLPGHEVNVVNAGIGGNSAHQMYQRIQSDVLDEEPKLVVWQTGIYDAVHDQGVERFKRILRKGIAMLREGGADVVLMDQIPLPRAERFPSYPAYVEALREVARETATPVFRRHDLLATLVRDGRLSAEDLIPADAQSRVDGSYHCVGTNLARSLAEKLSPRAVPERN